VTTRGNVGGFQVPNSSFHVLKAIGSRQWNAVSRDERGSHVVIAVGGEKRAGILGRKGKNSGNVLVASPAGRHGTGGRM